ncbi:MAG: phosphate ABC transporter permease subunit PstC [Thermomicrobium sp.]|nr:phosphate ABC transporter permease subunit PstC [Thermomicrobium sp.]
MTSEPAVRAPMTTEQTALLKEILTGHQRIDRIRRIRESVILALLFSAAAISILTTVGIIYTLSLETILFFRDASTQYGVTLVDFLTDTQWTPLFVDKHFGIWPLAVGTALVSAIAMAVALPLGLLAAIGLSEYIPDRIARFLKPILEILAGVPTVVYGYFALLFVTPLLQRLIPELEVFNALSAGIVMGIMILPLVASLSEDAMRAVPHALREGAYALGATRLEVVWRVVIPSSLSGIVAAFILAISRAIGETMIVAIAMGQVPRFTFNPLVAMQAMTSYIVQVSLGDTPHGTLEYRTIFAVGTTLFVVTMALNLISYRFLTRFREVYQ